MAKNLEKKKNPVTSYSLKKKLNLTRKAIKRQHDAPLRTTWTQIWKNNLKSTTDIEEGEQSKLEKIIEWLTVHSQWINYISVTTSIVFSLIYYITFIILFSNEGLYLQSWITGQILSTRTWTLYVPILFYFISAVQIYHVRNDYLAGNESDMIGLGGLFILIIASFSLNDCILIAKHISVNKYAQAIEDDKLELAKKLCSGFLNGLHEGATHSVIHPPAKFLANQLSSSSCCKGSIGADSPFWSWVSKIKPEKLDPSIHHEHFNLPEEFTCCSLVNNECICLDDHHSNYKMCLEPWWDMIRDVCIGSYLTGILYALSLYMTVIAYILHYKKMKERAKATFGTKSVPAFIRRTESLGRREQIKKLLLPRLRKRHAENRKNKIQHKYMYTLVQGEQSTTYTVDTRNYKGVRSWRKSKALKDAIARARACRVKDQNEMPGGGPMVTELHFKTKAEAKQVEKKLKSKVLANKRKRYEELEKNKLNLKPTLAKNAVKLMTPDEKEKTELSKTVNDEKQQPQNVNDPQPANVTDPNVPPEEAKHKKKRKNSKVDKTEPQP